MRRELGDRADAVVGWAVGDAHALPPDEVARELGTDMADGLSEEEAQERLVRVGPNALERARRPPYAEIALRQLGDPLVALLVAAAAVSFAIGDRVEGIAIAVIVVLNGLLGFGQELGAERALIALRGTLQQRATVIRRGRERALPAENLVPGDLVVLREGERVPADGRLVRAAGLAVDESQLTGESVPVAKSVAAVASNAPLADRTSAVFAGTAVTRGRATALVTATGPRAEVGRVASLAAEAKPPPTPLQRRLRGLTRVMVGVGVVITVGLAAVRLAQGAPVDDAFLLGVSVAVAAVPEGLAATVTIALALGARRMAERGAIVRRLPAVETLGSATVVASDKTGTLTENRLRLAAVAAAPGRSEEELLRAAVLASTARLAEEDGSEPRVAGDPVEGALLLAAREQGMPPERLRAGLSQLRELPFDPERKRMTLLYTEDGALHAYMKGAPEAVLARSRAPEPARRELEERAEAWASEGLRVLAVAQRELESADVSDEELERGHALLGLVALSDPLRPAARQAVQDALAAGLRLQILTGDHPATAHAVARALGLSDEAVSARVTPGDKLRLVEALQQEGEVVAVTGDGVNDAPALRRSDVGVAMGRSGTEAAREAADLVLTNDDFSTIVAAIREGRTIADNVRKFVAFLLSANFGEVLLFAVVVLAGLGVPMTVVQVLIVNVVTDGLPAVALAQDRPPPSVTNRPPERGDVLFTRASWLALGLVGTIVGAAAVGGFLAGRAMDGDAARTMAFATVALSELFLVFAVRSPLQPAWREPVNVLLLASVAVSAGLVALAIYLPGLHDPLGTVALDATELAVVVALALVPFVAVENAKALLRRFAPDWASAALRTTR
ncbi:MAG TPA: cation-transporting P-type ATPase [Methylomirabilota bacterium]